MATHKLPRFTRTGNQQVMFTDWYSDNEALRLEYDTNTDQVVKASRFDIRTGSTKVLPRLTAAIRAIGAEPENLSPDGRWLSCWIGGPRFPETMYAVALDGSRTIRWTAVRRLTADVVYIGWMPESEGYLVLYVDEAVIYPLDRTKAVRRIRIPGLPPGGYACDLSPDGHVVAVTLEGGRSPSTIYHFRLDEKAPDVHKYDIRPPADYTIESVTANFRTGRIAWELSRRDASYPSGWLGKLMRLLGRKPHDTEGIWISRLDGTKMEELGHVHSLDSYLEGWLPSGRALAYVVGESVYVVPVP
jgi:hypothetical protein